MFNLENSKVLAQKILMLVDRAKYDSATEQSRRIGKNVVYVPCAMDGDTLASLLENPFALRLESQRNKGAEPAYGCLNDALNGRNIDGTPHAGFLLIDVRAKPAGAHIQSRRPYVKDLVDREKDSRLPYAAQSGHLQAIVDGLKSEDSGPLGDIPLS